MQHGQVMYNVHCMHICIQYYVTLTSATSSNYINHDAVGVSIELYC